MLSTSNMDLTYFLFLLFLPVSFYFVKLLYQGGGRKLNYPPGKTGWPIIGQGHELFRAGRKGFPENFFLNKMQEYSSPIFTTSLFGEVVTVFCGASSNKFLFANENKLVKLSWPPTVTEILPSTKKETKILRKLLTMEELQSYIGIMDSMARKHFENFWDNKEEVIVHPLVKKFTFSMACQLFLSINDQVYIDDIINRFSDVTKGFFTLQINLPGTPFHRAIKAAEFIRKELILIIKDRKKHLVSADHIKKDVSKQDILSRLILSHGDSNNSDEDKSEMNMADMILGLLIAGHDTTSVVVTAIVKYLAEFPEVYEIIRHEQMEIWRSKENGEMLHWKDIQKMKFSWNVACEAMRLAPPAQVSFKQALTDFTHAGYFIPKGRKLCWSIISTHKNPEYFPNPEKFDPWRFKRNEPAPYTFVPFGGGPRMCPGKEYSRLEILVFMHHLVTKYKWDKLIPNDEKLYFNPFPLPLKGLPIRLHPQTNKSSY